MNTRNFLLFLSLCICLGINSGCNKNPVEPPATVPVKPLQGIEWKLTAFVDVETGTAKKPEPDGDWAYRLTFKTDTSYNGFSSANTIAGTYKADYETQLIHINNVDGTKVVENIDGGLYVKALWTVQSFTVADNELRLYYNNKQNYLLFKSLTK